MVYRPVSSLPLPLSTLTTLTRAGYECVEDLVSSSVEELVQGLLIDFWDPIRIVDADLAPALGFSPADCEIILASATTSTQAPAATQTALHLTRNVPTDSDVIPTSFSFLDSLLCGGVRRGYVYELCGPPGAPHVSVARQIAKAFLNQGDNVKFAGVDGIYPYARACACDDANVADFQNMTGPAALLASLGNVSSESLTRLYCLSPSSVLECMLFIRNLLGLLDTERVSPLTRVIYAFLLTYALPCQKAGLLVLNMLSYPFHTAHNLRPPAKIRLLEQIRDVLMRATATYNLTVVVTCQLATKMIHPDGSPSNFDADAVGVVQSQLGTSYLPSGRSWRVMLRPDSPTTGAKLRLWYNSKAFLLMMVAGVSDPENTEKRAVYDLFEITV
ncbi:hypothetical protein FISHEDRAFT_74217 [Fistulina hepatica ATCC 64428]|uniref:DNA recombination and repair protein Rad51-like C-terminal domain-containing protein n=1 Tax=Fistulina hepatica ATCC 64428 TaxID=1128425 RepID=A0A0D7AB50_9AGAR|nr:hypothetical protein FISHEDRAFT_74217 [Fistulina hepatica ATCC 64428]